MSGPGVYVPDVTEGITRVEDLPQPRIKLRSRNFSCRRCPFCGGRGGRWGVASRTVHDLGDSLSGRPERVASPETSLPAGELSGSTWANRRDAPPRPQPEFAPVAGS